MLFGMYQCFMLLSTCNDATWSVFRPWKTSQINSAACSGSSSFWHSSLTYIISILFKCFKTWAVLMRCFLFVLRLKSPGNKTSEELACFPLIHYLERQYISILCICQYQDSHSFITTICNSNFLWAIWCHCELTQMRASDQSLILGQMEYGTSQLYLWFHNDTVMLLFSSHSEIS